MSVSGGLQIGYCNPPDLCYTLSINRRGRKRGHHTKGTDTMSSIATNETAELIAAITPDIYSDFDGRIDVLTAPRVYFIYTRMIDGARDGHVVFQPINAKTGKPWQAWREIKGLTNWATPWLPFADIAAGVAAHIAAAGLVVDDVKWVSHA